MHRKLFLLLLYSCSIIISVQSQAISILNPEFDSTHMRITTNAITFKIEDYNHLFQDTTRGAYSIFLYCGDGRYEELKVDDTLLDSSSVTISHAFPRADEINQSFIAEYDSIYAEVTKLYDENDPPKRLLFEGPGGTTKLIVDCSAGNYCIRPDFLILKEQIELTANRDIVPGHEITFIIKYDVGCATDSAKIVFEYDKYAFDINDFTFSSSGFITQNPASDTSRAQICWKADSLKINNGAKGVLYVEATADSVYLQELLSSSLLITATLAGDACTETVSELLDAEVSTSHDPNDLDSESDFSCLDIAELPPVKYVIKFQNTGEGPARTVIVKDIIPDVYDVSTIELIYPPVVIGRDSISFRVDGQLATWVLSGKFLNAFTNKTGQLHGTAERLFGLPYPEEFTRDEVIFTIQYNDDFQPEPCDAIINQAEIIFDCNNAYYTNPHVLDFSCDPDTDSCYVCNKTMTRMPPVTWASTAESVVRMDTIFPILDSLNNVAGTISSFRWYPPPLSGANTLTPEIVFTKNIDYYLVLSNAAAGISGKCTKEIITFPIRVDCDLQINTNINCDTAGVKWLEANVTSDNLFLNDLSWQDCSEGRTFNLEITNYSQDSILLSVVDRVSNCYTIVKVGTECNNPIGPDIPGWGWGVLAFLLVGGAYTYFNRK